MATYKLSVPNKQFAALTPVKETEVKNVASKVKSKYSTYVDKAADLSNLPKELIYAFIAAASNGENNAVFKGHDGEKRMGLFSLSNKEAKKILRAEKQNNRLSAAEIAWLSEDPKVKAYIENKLPIDSAPNDLADFDLTDPKVSIAIGSLLLGQKWDSYKGAIDKVIITALLPDSSNLKRKVIADWGLGKGLDYTVSANFNTLKNLTAANYADSLTVNPNKTDVASAMTIMLSPNGSMDILTRK